jgi:GH25 family lysozyme M1 (1,4-beta-N-acetylmuramidase)
MASATPPIRGVDVSMWQGASINWHAVAQSGIRFAFVKASEGPTFVDPDYARNVTAARANGLVAGAYDYAQPSGKSDAAVRNDATIEANHFVTVARPQATDLRPVIDIETTGGLGKGPLRLWLSTWVATVHARIHARPLIYTSPYFWQVHLGDTTALSGTAMLWVAHWTSAATPWVPAANWGSHGWNVWQWSDCRRIPGIPGCVDGDRIPGPSLLGLRIGSVPASVDAPAVGASPAVGFTISAATGHWTGTAPISFTLQWLRCNASGSSCQPIPGATASTYLPAVADYEHTLRVAVTAHNRLGAHAATSAPSAAVVDRTPPAVPSFGSPMHSFLTGTAFSGRWHSSDAVSGLASYDIQVRRLPAGGVAGRWTPLLTATTQTASQLTTAAGTTTCLHARAHDKAGNVSAWSGQRCATAPIPAAALGRYGHWWVNRTNGSIATLSAGAAAFHRNVTASTLLVVARTCATCGVVEVEWDGKVLRRASLVSKTDGTAQIVVPLGATRTGSLRIVSAVAGRGVLLRSVSLLRIA